MKSINSIIEVKVDPRRPQARVLTIGSQGETLLKARLSHHPKYPRALQTLLEALSLWQGVRVHAVLAVGEEEPWCDMGSYGIQEDDRDSHPGWEIEVTQGFRKKSRKRNDSIVGMGEFRDLRQMEFFSEALSNGY